jgi:hypothetical protein
MSGAILGNDTCAIAEGGSSTIAYSGSTTIALTAKTKTAQITLDVQLPIKLLGFRVSQAASESNVDEFAPPIEIQPQPQTIQIQPALIEIQPPPPLRVRKGNFVNLNPPIRLNLVDPKIYIRCTPGSRQRASSFIITGRGGLPTNPGDPLSPDAMLVDLISLNPKNDKATPLTSQPTTATPKPIVEATGLVKNNQGELILTANPPTATLHASWSTPISCSTSNSK